MNRKIETGCLALVVMALVPENLGKIVTVGRFLGDVKGFKYSNRWEVDRILVGNMGTLHRHAAERQLMRIDPEEKPVKELAQARSD